MKKILLLLPIIGICSSLFAQAPKVENVNAQQSVGTKDVQINFQCSAKAGTPSLNLEVWFRENLSKTQWTRASSLSKADGTYLATNAEVEAATGIETIYSHRLEGITEALQTQTLIWNAGTDAPDVSTAEAQVRVIAFYDKFDEYGTPTPSAQVSGWNGIDDGNGSSTSDSNGTAGGDNNGTAPEGLAVYYLSDTQTQFLTDGAVFAFGNYAIEIYTDEFGVEYKNLVPVIDNGGTFERDLGKSPSTISSAQFPTVADIDNWITEQGLFPVGTLVESGGGV
jgi:hypothetical protein